MWLLHSLAKKQFHKCNGRSDWSDHRNCLYDHYVPSAGRRCRCGTDSVHAIVLITLNAFDITLTLPGIAGIILGIGMAVDANVIIYARIRKKSQPETL